MTTQKPKRTSSLSSSATISGRPLNGAGTTCTRSASSSSATGAHVTAARTATFHCVKSSSRMWLAEMAPSAYVSTLNINLFLCLVLVVFVWRREERIY